MALARQIRAGSAFIEVSLRNNLAKGLSNISRSLTGIGQRISIIGGSIAGVGTAALVPFIAFTKEFTAFSDTIGDISQRTGIGVEALSSLGFAAEQSGTDLNALVTGVRNMQKNLVSATKVGSEAAVSLDKLGLSAAELLDRSPEEQFKAIADSIAKIENPAKRTSTALALFGRRGQELLPLLTQGAGGISQLQDKAAQLGNVLDKEAVAKAQRLDDSLKALFATVRSGRRALGEVFAESVADTAEKMTVLAAASVRFIRANRELVTGFVRLATIATVSGAALAAVGGSVIGVGLAVSASASVVGAFAAVIGTVGSALAALATPGAVATRHD